jgi:DNA-binding protein HU-beta
MNKTEFVEVLAEVGSKSKTGANQDLDLVLDNLIAALKEEGKVTLSGFGVFSVVERAARNGVNPKTGAKIQIPASKTVKFRAAKNLKDAF